MLGKYCDEYYDYVLEGKPPATLARKIVFDILDDHQDRRGLRQEFEQIDDDIQEEIIEKWESIVQSNLNLNNHDEN